MSHEVVDKSQIFSRQMQRAFQFRIKNVDSIFFDVDNDVGDSSFLLEQNVRGTDHVTTDARLSQGVHVGQGQVRVAQVTPCENFER